MYCLHVLFTASQCHSLYITIICVQCEHNLIKMQLGAHIPNMIIPHSRHNSTIHHKMCVPQHDHQVAFLRQLFSSVVLLVVVFALLKSISAYCSALKHMCFPKIFTYCFVSCTYVCRTHALTVHISCMYQF